MLGRRIVDTEGVESETPETFGLGLFDIETSFQLKKSPIGSAPFVCRRTCKFPARIHSGASPASRNPAHCSDSLIEIPAL